MKTTIKDVAARAGVSTSTVSLVLNNKPVPIKPETKQRVWDAARQLNYQPNQLAVSLVTNRSNTVGMIVPDNSNPFFSDLAKNIEQEVNVLGYSMIIGSTGYNADKLQDYVNLFSARGVDGLIIAQPDFRDKAENDRCTHLLETLTTPIVLINRTSGSPNARAVSLNQFKAGYMATRHLLTLGHRRIGCITGSLTISISKDRLEGYMQALREFDIPYDPALVYEASLRLESGVEALPVLLGQEVTAIFAFNDLIAYGVYMASRNFHMSIPNDLSIISVDDIFFSQVIQPPLTTVRQPTEELARYAAESLHNLLEDKNSCRDPIVVEPQLMVRGSTRRI